MPFLTWMVHPKSVRRSSAFLVLVGLFLTSFALLPSMTSPAGASAASDAEGQFLTKLNQVRVNNGRRALVLDTRYSSTAREWSGRMSAANKLSHDPGLSSDASSVEPGWRSIGENVGYGYSVQQLHDAFMASTGHRNNILDADYNRVGIGVVYNGSKIWVTVRFMEGPTITGTTGLGPPPPPPGVKTALTGDFDGDQRDDLFVYGPGSAVDEAWFGRADRTMRKVSQSVTGQYRPVAGDFDGDGKTQILWYTPGSGADALWEWNGTSFVSTSVSVNGTYKPVVGDYDGDGRDDVLWYAPGTAADVYWFGNANGTFSSVGAEINGTYKPVVGDFDGNGGDDLLWYAKGSTKDFYWYATLRRGGYRSVPAEINGTYTPFSGDLDGSGTDDVFWYAPGSAKDFVWYQKTTRGAYTTVARTVTSTYLPAAGDFDGNGAEDIVWFSPTTASGDTQWWGTAHSTRFSSGPLSSS